jgi:hypothetical protein
MARIEDVDFSVRNVAPVGLRLREVKRQVMLPQITKRRGCVSPIQACHFGQATQLIIRDLRTPCIVPLGPALSPWGMSPRSPQARLRARNFF